MPINLVVATGNPGKLTEMQTYLAGQNCLLTLKPASLDIDETGKTFMENACLKASQTAKALQQWAIADDSGLAVAALNGAPGLYSARYGNTDQDRIQRLLRELQGESERQAEFICALAIAAPSGEICLQATGSIAGEILETPRGHQGFGYDPIFYVPERQKTFAEMDVLEKQKNSHRGIAFNQLIQQWPTLLTRMG